MGVDITKLQFYSGYPIDKIVAQGNLTINVGASPNPVTTPAIATTSVANPYGQAGFTTTNYSLDNINFYDQDVTVYYFDNITLSLYPQVQFTSASNSSNIYFMVTSYYRSAQTIYVNYDLDTIS